MGLSAYDRAYIKLFNTYKELTTILQEQGVFERDLLEGSVLACLQNVQAETFVFLLYKKLGKVRIQYKTIDCWLAYSKVTSRWMIEDTLSYYTFKNEKRCASIREVAEVIKKEKGER